MSTRATYEIVYNIGSSAVFYIHHDGYPKGAAQYFKATLDVMRMTNRDFLPSFQWANEQAEMIARHNLAGDTEYRYVIERVLPVVEARYHKVSVMKRTSFCPEEFEQEWEGSLLDFIEVYSQEVLSCDGVWISNCPTV